MTEQAAYVVLLERQVADLEAENGRLRALLNDTDRLMMRVLRLTASDGQRAIEQANAEHDRLAREVERLRMASSSG